MRLGIKKSIKKKVLYIVINFALRKWHIKTQTQLINIIFTRNLFFLSRFKIQHKSYHN